MNICKMVRTMPGINVPSLLLRDSDGMGVGTICAIVIAEAKVHIVVIISEKY